MCMNLTLDLGPEIERNLLVQAQARGFRSRILRKKC
jgi:hypothetical protein